MKSVTQSGFILGVINYAVLAVSLWACVGAMALSTNYMYTACIYMCAVCWETSAALMPLKKVGG